MTLRELVSKFNFTAKVGIKTSFLDISIEYSDVDRLAAWDLYIELITRVITQDLEDGTGDEQSALNSIFGVFDLTRSVLHKNGPRCISFAKVAILVLNKIIRPFTSKWHEISLQGTLNDPEYKKLFRQDLSALHVNLKTYMEILAQIAGLDEDITNLNYN